MNTYALVTCPPGAPVVEVDPDQILGYRHTPAGAVALITGLETTPRRPCSPALADAVEVPLGDLLAYVPGADRVILPAEQLGDLVAAADELALDVRAHDRGEPAAELARRAEHAIRAALDAARPLRPWQLP